MEPIVRTIFSSFLQTAQILKTDYVVPEHSTLNEKFNIQSGIYPDTSILPGLRYFAIGNGGHKMTVGANGLAKPDPVQHRATDAALFSHIPFALRELDNDLDSVERAKYGLRRKELYNGQNYIAYYLKRIDLTNVVPEMEYITVNNGVQTVNAYTSTSANLNPTPPDISSNGVNLVTGDYVAASAKVNINFTNSEISELLNAANIVYGDQSYAIISEVALCTGVDKLVQSPAANNTVINFNEVIATQVASFINTFYAVEFTNNGIEIALDIGICEPLLNISQ